MLAQTFYGLANYCINIQLTNAILYFCNKVLKEFPVVVILQNTGLNGGNKAEKWRLL